MSLVESAAAPVTVPAGGLDVSPSRETPSKPPPLRLLDAIVLRDDAMGRALGRFIDRMERRVYAAGMRLELSDDFELLAEINPFLDKAPLTSQFDPGVSDIGPANGFWFKGINAKGEIIQTMALRLYDYRETTIALELESLRTFYADPSASAHPEETCTVTAPAAHGITGRVCYQGDFWIKAASGLRGTGLSYPLSRLGMAIAFARWEPDFFFATVHDGIVRKGVAAQYGYRNLQPGGVYRVLPRTDEILDEWLIWMDWRDVMDMVERESA